MENVELNMKKVLDNLVSEYGIMRVGRANPKILDKVKVDYYGSLVSVNKIAAVSVQNARELIISPWDDSATSSIEKAIQNSNIGINPIRDGKNLKLSFPQLTGENRKELVKDVNKMKEYAKVSIRHIRQDFMNKLKKMEKNGEITKDELRIKENKLQDVVQKYNDNIDAISKKKEKEILESLN